jgi:hypothetical protein
MKRNYAEFMIYAYRGERRRGEALADMILAVWHDIKGLVVKIVEAKTAGVRRYRRAPFPRSSFLRPVPRH